MRVLFVHEVGYVEKPIFEMHEFPEYLAIRQHTIGFLDYLERRTPKSKLGFGSQIVGKVREDAQLSLFSQGPTIEGIFGRLITALIFPFFFTKVLKRFSPDIVVSFSVPTSGWQAAILCKFFRIPFVFRALDVSHKIRETRLAPLVKVAERVVYKTATHVSCNNPAMLNYCRSLGAVNERSTVELPPLDLSHFLSGSNLRKDLRNKLGIGQKERVIIYMGSFFYFSGLDIVIRELAQLEDQPHLVLIGGGEKDRELRSLVDQLGLNERVKFTGYIDFAKLPGYLSIADVAINPMVPTLVSNAALPNKVLQYMASGLPVVTTRLEGIHSLFPDESGIKYEVSSADVLDGAVSWLSSEELADLGQSNRAAVESKFDLDNSVDKFEQLLNMVWAKS